MSESTPAPANLELTGDPLEKDNIIEEIPPEEMDTRREELLEWWTGAAYD